jgi:hypothetical protein
MLLLLLLLSNSFLSVPLFVIWKLRKTNPSVKLSNISVISATKKNPLYCQAQKYPCHLKN